MKATLEEIFKNIEEMFNRGAIDEQTMLDTMASFETEAEEEILTLARSYILQEAQEKIIREEEKRLASKRRISEKINEQKAELIKNYMQRIGKDKIKSPLIDLAIRSSKAVEITADVPTDFCRVKFEPDLKTIKEKIEAGEKIGFAKIVERKNLNIK
jgi:Siphovirus Gp157